MVTIETGQSSLVIFELTGYSHTKYTIKIKSVLQNVKCYFKSVMFLVCNEPLLCLYCSEYLNLFAGKRLGVFTQNDIKLEEQGK